MTLFTLNLKEERIFGLDLLRFLAIILVLVSHGRHLLEPMTNSTRIMSIGGYWGVELFFVLSGFLIGGILIRIYENENILNKNVILNFWKRRWFRTLPNYYLILLINFFLALILGKFDFFDWRFYLYPFFLQNFFTEHPHFFEEAWSLAVEEWFYISFPLILSFISFSFFRDFSKKNKILFSIILIFILCFFLKLLIVLKFNPDWDFGVRKITPLRLDSILTGVFFAWCKYYYADIFNKSKWLTFIISLSLIAFSGYFYFYHIMEYGTIKTSLFGKTAYFTITSLAFGLLLPICSFNQKTKPTNPIKKGVTIISLISYSMYLLHFSLVLKGISLFSYINDSVVTSIFFYLVYLGTTTILSILLFKYYERPMTELRNYSSNGKQFLGVKEYFKIAIRELKKASIE